MKSELRNHSVVVEPGVELHVVEAGEGPAVVLLHGFPDFWFSWRHQVDALVAAGFRVIMPDQRGYDLSSKPKDVAAYGVKRLAADVAAILDACGVEKAHVVGHDWGGGVAWAFAMAHPERLAKLAVLNCPHPQRMLSGLRSPRQLARSWYMFMFQIPAIPEAIMRGNDFAILAKAMEEEPTRPGAVTSEDIAKYKEAWGREGALSGMVAWYRAMFKPALRVRLSRIDAPVLVLWGDHDVHLGVELAAPLASLVPHARTEIIRGASHWVQIDAPEVVNRELVSFFA